MALFETNIYYVLNTLQIVLFQILLEIYLYAYYNEVTKRSNRPQSGSLPV